MNFGLCEQRRMLPELKCLQGKMQSYAEVRRFEDTADRLVPFRFGNEETSAMACVTVVGLGPGPLALMTKQAEQCLLSADKVFIRTSAYPAYGWLQGLGKTLVAFDSLYALPWPNADDLYDFMVSALLKEASLRHSVTYALPGSPSVLEDTTRKLKARGRAAGVEIRIVQGLSFVEPILAAVDFDFSLGLQIVLPRTHLKEGLFDPRIAMLVCQLNAKARPDDPPQVDRTVDWLLAAYPANHDVTLIWTAGLPAYDILQASLRLDEVVGAHGDDKYFSSLFVPPLMSRNR
ncbi:hypothetical protein BH11PSE3_BH11PSE3_42450 [soil metagenome]